MDKDLYATIRDVQDEFEEKRNKALTEHIRELNERNVALRTALVHTRDAFRRLRAYAALGHGAIQEDLCSCGCAATDQCGKKGCIHCDYQVIKLASSNKEN